MTEADIKHNKAMFVSTYQGAITSYWRNIIKSESTAVNFKYTAEKMVELLEHPDIKVKQLGYFLTPVEVQKQAYTNAIQAAGGTDPFKAEAEAIQAANDGVKDMGGSPTG